VPVGIGTSSAQPLIFGTNGFERARIDASGNLGLGVTPSAWGTNLRTIDIGFGTALTNANSTTDTWLSSNAYYTTQWLYKNAAEASYYQQASGQHRWHTAPSGTAGNAISFVQAMTLDASGNLVVGATSGNFNGNNQAISISAAQSGTTSAAIDIRGYATSDATIGQIPFFNGANLLALISTARRGANNSGSLEFYTNNAGSLAERARFTSGGYFKASNDGTYLGSTDSYHELRASGAAADYIVNINTPTATAANCYGARVYYSGAAPNGAGNVFLACQDNAATRATIRSNGGLANFQSNNVDLSDARTKKDITPVASMWDKIGALEIVAYKYLDQTHDDVNLGVIAQQVETVEPVWVDPDGFGETPADGIPLKTVYTKDITFAAIKALQEAMTRIESLEQRVLALGA